MEDAINNIEEVIITDYFYCGFQYSAIIGFLKKHQRLCIHVRTGQISNNLCMYHHVILPGPSRFYCIRLDFFHDCGYYSSWDIQVMSQS